MVELGSIDAHIEVWGLNAVPMMVRKKKGFEAMTRLLDHLEFEEAKAKSSKRR